MTGLREKKKIKTFRIIRETAKELFNTIGFEKVTIEDIARKAEVGVGTVYNYFKTKYAILFEVSMEENKQAIREVRELLKEPYEDPLEHLLDLMMVHIKPFYTLDKQFIIDMFVAFFKHSTEFAKDYDFEEENEVAITMEMLKKLQEDGHLKEDIDIFSTAMVLHGLLMLNYMMVIFPLDVIPVTKENLRDVVRAQLKIVFFGMGKNNGKLLEENTGGQK